MKDEAPETTEDKTVSGKARAATVGFDFGCCFRLLLSAVAFGFDFGLAFGCCFWLLLLDFILDLLFPPSNAKIDVGSSVAKEELIFVPFRWLMEVERFST